MINLFGGNPKNRDYNLAIIIARPFWGQGFGREMVEFITRYAFRELGVHRLSLQVAASNLRAIKCYETAGFRHEGRLRQANFQNDSWSDELLMGLLRQDLPKKPPPPVGGQAPRLPSPIPPSRPRKTGRNLTFSRERKLVNFIKTIRKLLI
jgi:hypothetical protein